jgi:hypothetical protein
MANRVSSEQSHLCYEYGAKVFNGQIVDQKAADILAELNMNRTTAFFLVSAVRLMLQGDTYTRTASILTTKVFLERIHDEFGKAGLKNALKSLMGNIEYRFTSKGDSCLGLKRLHAEFSELLR